MVHVLSGAALSDRIHDICKGEKVDLAVAFWGLGMRKTLFGESDLKHVRIICDISMRSTTRAALRELDAPSNRNLTIRDQFHGKMYISERGAVVGSANASGNSIGLTAGEAGHLTEIGVFLPPNFDVFDAARAEFDRLWDPRTWVTRAVLERAAVVSRESRPALGDTDLDKLTLIERIRLHPELFAGVSIAVADRGLEEEDTSARLDEANALDEFTGSLNFSNVIVMDEDDHNAVAEISHLVLLIYYPNAGRKSVTGYVGARPFPFQKPDIVFGKANWSAFARSLRQPSLRSRSLTRKEWDLIAILAQKDKWLYTAEEFATAMDTAEAGLVES